jgi:exosortase/archaeosortase family protein
MTHLVRCTMRTTKLLLALSVIAVFAVFFFHTFTTLDKKGDVGGRAALGAFEFFGVAASLYLLSKGQPGNVSRADWLGCAFAMLVACAGFAASSITLFAFYLLFRNGDDLNTKAAGTVAGAVMVQAVWAPLAFSKISFLLLQIDAGVVGWIISHLVPDASWSGTVVHSSSEHNVEITPACASFHNLSLASLCWVTLTMLHRPYWLKSDLYIGLSAMLIQFVFNIWRLVFVCLSPPMYDFWHDGFGKHIFSLVATACAVIFVQFSLVRRDQRFSRRGVAAIS